MFVLRGNAIHKAAQVFHTENIVAFNGLMSSMMNVIISTTWHGEVSQNLCEEVFYCT